MNQISERDLQQTIDFWNDWLMQKKSANIGEFMLYGGRALEACRELQQRRAFVPFFDGEEPKPTILLQGESE